MKNIFLSFLFSALMLSANAQKNTIIITTAYGKVTMELFDNTPKHRDNMLKLVKEKFYDGTLFHRVIPEFMIQGGDPDSKNAKKDQMLGNGDVGYRVDAEINDVNFHQYGALAAARDNNPNKSSSGCQFYIVVGKKFTDEQLDQLSQRSGRTFTPAQREVYKTIGGTPHLDGNYTVYGQVTSGMDVVEKIIDAKRNQHDRPYDDQVIIKMRKKKFLGMF
ncbi:MAG: peptidylprolyl isomerase [Chitinophagales bacterium]|nr:peptidylprolyl isomerase [Chitinophagales bacterium]